MTLKRNFLAAAFLSTALFALPACADSGKAELTSAEHDHASHSREPAANITPISADELPAFTLSEAPEDHVIGENTAPVTMIVYASVTCPHCSDWFINQWPAVKKGLVEAGKIRFIFRPLPTAPQQLSMIGFVIAECAAEDKYYETIEYQMENQKSIFEQAEAGQGRQAYEAVAKVAGLEGDALKACLSDPSKVEHIHLSSERATAGKIQGVPAFFVNGDLYSGQQEAKALIKLIDDMNEKGLSKLPANLP